MGGSFFADGREGGRVCGWFLNLIERFFVKCIRMAFGGRPFLGVRTFVINGEAGFMYIRF